MKKFLLNFILFLLIVCISKAQEFSCCLSYEILGKGEPIIVIHGGPGLDHNYLSPYLKALSNKNKLIYYDQRGSGNSESIIDTTTINLTTFLNDLDLLVKKLGLKKVILLGHSWGSLLAIKYASLHPNKIKALILAGSVGLTPVYLKEMNTIILSRRTKEDSTKISLVQRSKEFSEGNRTKVEEFIDIYFHAYFYDSNAAQIFKVNIDGLTAKNFLSIYSLMTKYLVTTDLREDVKIIKVPTLIITGEYDPIPIKYAEELNRLIQKSKLMIIKNTGHFAFVENNEEFIRDCEKFLAQLP